MSSSSIWWLMRSTSVFPRFIFSPCQVNSPFYSSRVSCSSCLPFATRERSYAYRSFFMASFITVFLLMRSSTDMNNSGLSKLPCLSPILTSKSSDAPSTTTLAVVFSYMPSTITSIMVLPSTVASPSPSLWVLCQRLSPNRRTPEPYCPVPPVSSPPSVSGCTSRLLFVFPS